MIRIFSLLFILLATVTFAESYEKDSVEYKQFHTAIADGSEALKDNDEFTEILKAHKENTKNSANINAIREAEKILQTKKDTVCRSLTSELDTKEHIAAYIDGFYRGCMYY